MNTSFFLPILILASFLATGLCRGSDSIARQIERNRVDLGTTISSPDHYWHISMIQESVDGPYSLIISHKNFHQKITESAKPDNRICWSEDSTKFVVIKPLGFCTMADVFVADQRTNSIIEVFSSETTNERNFVDFLLQRWDMKNKCVVFDIVESPRYLEGRKPRLFATEYVYLDGRNGFQLSDH